MRKTWVKLALIGMVCAGAAQADHAPGHGMKGLTMGGSAEAGWNFNLQTGATASHFILDHAAMSMTAEVSDKAKVVVSNAFAVTDGGGLAGGGAANTATYFSGARLTTGGTGSVLTFANNGAYLEHKCADGFSTAVGHFMMPVGMESLNTRYDMPTYYFSRVFSTMNTRGWTFDTGFKVTLTDYLPGTMEIALVDGHRANLAGENLTPATALRWWTEVKSGDMSFTPVVSGYFGRWRSGPEDIGVTAGGMFKSGTFWANAEFLLHKPKTSTATEPKTWGFYVEPGADLGMANVSVKWDYANVDAGAGGTSDMNIGLALTKNYSDKLRIRATYQLSNLSKKLAAVNNHDIRLLFGTKW